MGYPHLPSPSRTSAYQEGSFLFLLVIAGAAFGYALSCVLGGPAADEGFHAPQIWHYYTGGKDYADNLTVPPTYHYVIAFVMRQIGHYSDYILRLINLLVSLCALPLFYTIARRYYPEAAGIRMLQLFFLPLMFPYFFLIYTDIWALVFIALCFYFTLRGWYWAGALAGIGAVMLRQDAVIWVGLAYLLLCFEGWSFTQPQHYRQLLKNALYRGLPFLALFVAFIAFVIYNKGVAIGDAHAHDIVHFNISNLYIFLTCAWLVFLPLNIVQAPDIARQLKNPWVIFLVLAGFLFYMGTFDNPHGYNNTHFGFFLHNGLLYIMLKSTLGQALFYIPIVWMALTLLTMKLPEKRFYWLWAIIPVATICHPLVEPRYYFPAYMLINIWRPRLPAPVELGWLAVFIGLAAFIMYGTVTGWFFL